jgi:hypothetical protein
MFGSKKRRQLLSEGIVAGGENAIANKETEGLSQRQIVFRRFVRHRGAMISLSVLTVLIVFVYTSLGLNLFGIHIPGWWKWSITDLPELSVCKTNIVGCPTLSVMPSFLGGNGIHLGDHPFGQDNIGLDYFALVMRGAQRSILIMFIIGIIAGTLGTIVGAIAGFYRGWTDALLMRFLAYY